MVPPPLITVTDLPEHQEKHDEAGAHHRHQQPRVDDEVSHQSHARVRHPTPESTHTIWIIIITEQIIHVHTDCESNCYALHAIRSCENLVRIHRPLAVNASDGSQNNNRQSWNTWNRHGKGKIPNQGSAFIIQHDHISLNQLHNIQIKTRVLYPFFLFYSH